MEEKTIYKIKLQNGFTIKTKNLQKTLEKLFSDEAIDVVAVTHEGALQWVYIHREGFEALKNGEEITATTTLTPFSSLRGTVEAFGYIKLKNIF